MDAQAMVKNALALPSRSELAAPLEQLVERARGYAADSRAPAVMDPPFSRVSRDAVSHPLWMRLQGTPSLLLRRSGRGEVLAASRVRLPREAPKPARRLIRSR